MRFLTKFALKRPITIILSLITVLFFGLQAIYNGKVEFMPDINLPFLVVTCVYPGASPEDIDTLVSSKIEDAVSSVSGVKSVQAFSLQNISMVPVQYNFGTDMNKAYFDLKKSLENIKNDLPKDAKDPSIDQFDINGEPDIVIVATGGTDENLRSYIKEKILPSFERISSAGKVELSGGKESYVSVALRPSIVNEYRINMEMIAEQMKHADYNIPLGSIKYGDGELNVNVKKDFKDFNKIKRIPITVANGDVVPLDSIADVKILDDKGEDSFYYNGNEVVGISISKRQSASANELTKSVNKTINDLKNTYPNLKLQVISDTSKFINISIVEVIKTLIASAILSMIVLFLFFGDIKASLIVGSSIPISVMLTLALMGASHFSLNIISLGSLVLGIGMIVDASIVVIESCFRNAKYNSIKEIAIKGTAMVSNSVFGSVATTCVVFLPLVALKGLSGQLFTQLGLTICFCMVSSLFSAIMIVPMLYVFFTPKEKTDNFMSKILADIQSDYRRAVRYLLPKKIRVIASIIVMFIFSLVMASRLGSELLPVVDEGIINVNANYKQGLNKDDVRKLAVYLQDNLTNKDDIDNYILTYGVVNMHQADGNTINMTINLKKNRKHTTNEILNNLKAVYDKNTESNIRVSLGSNLMGEYTNKTSQLVIKSTNYSDLQEASDRIIETLRKNPNIKNAYVENGKGASNIRLEIDDAAAAKCGLNGAMLAGLLYDRLHGIKTMEFANGNSLMEVKLEYPKDEYDSLSKLSDMIIFNQSGKQIKLSDIAKVSFVNTSIVVTRQDKEYDLILTAIANSKFKGDLSKVMTDAFHDTKLPIGVEIATNVYDDLMKTEMKSLLNAVLVAIFLIFIVMAIQFESPRFSFMVMFTIPFSLIGAFLFLFLFGVKITLPTMVGFSMMVGTVVNNGILYVDTVNMLRNEMEIDDAVVEAGVIRIRPILMTTLTTMLSMIPMAIGYGSAGKQMQGLALVNVGGLVASTLMSLLLLPVLYRMIYYKKLNRALKKQAKAKAGIVVFILVSALTFNYSTSNAYASFVGSRTNEQWEQLKDNNINIDELYDLVSEYNPSVNDNELKVKQFKNTYGESNTHLQDVLNDMADELDSTIVTPDVNNPMYPLIVASNAKKTAQVDALRRQADETLDDYSIKEMEFNIAKYNIYRSCFDNFINYKLGSINIDKLNKLKDLEVLKKQINDSSLNHGYTSYNDNLQQNALALQKNVDIEKANNDNLSLKNKLLLAVGKSSEATLMDIDENIVIRLQNNIASIIGDNNNQTLFCDNAINKALDNNLALKILKRKNDNAYDADIKNNLQVSINNKENNIKIALNNGYLNIKNAKNAYEKSKSDYEVAKKNNFISDSMYKVGNISLVQKKMADVALVDAYISTQKNLFDYVKALDTYKFMILGYDKE